MKPFFDVFSFTIIPVHFKIKNTVNQARTDIKKNHELFPNGIISKNKPVFIPEMYVLPNTNIKKGN